MLKKIQADGNTPAHLFPAEESEITTLHDRIHHLEQSYKAVSSLRRRVDENCFAVSTVDGRKQFQEIIKCDCDIDRNLRKYNFEKVTEIVNICLFVHEQCQDA